MTHAITSFDDSLRPRLAAGAVLSLLAHGAVLAVVVGIPQARTNDLPRTLNPPATEASHPPPTPLGIEQSRAVSINWLGFADPTEHHARPAEVEQAQLSPLDAGVPEPPAQASPAEAEPTPQPDPQPVAEPNPAPAPDVALEPAPEPTPTETPTEIATPAPAETPAEAAPESRPSEPVAESTNAPSPLAVIEETSAAATEQLFRVVRQATARAQQLAELAAQQAAQQAAESAPEQPAQPPTQSAAQAANPAKPTGDTPDANPSPKEADATSTDDVAEWIPGRPAAAQGLDITTVRPQWNITTRLSAVPRNPVVRIDFRKNGTVAKAEFLPGNDTGYRDVDGPLLNAIYNWTAKGKALDELPAGDPKAVVSIKMQVILVPSRGTLRRANPNR